MKHILGVSFQFCIFYSSKRWIFFAKTDSVTLELKHTDSNEGKMQDGEGFLIFICNIFYIQRIIKLF